MSELENVMSYRRVFRVRESVSVKSVRVRKCYSKRVLAFERARVRGQKLESVRVKLCVKIWKVCVRVREC